MHSWGLFCSVNFSEFHLIFSVKVDNWNELFGNLQKRSEKASVSRKKMRCSLKFHWFNFSAKQSWEMMNLKSAYKLTMNSIPALKYATCLCQIKEYLWKQITAYFKARFVISDEFFATLLNCWVQKLKLQTMPRVLSFLGLLELLIF